VSPRIPDDGHTAARIHPRDPFQLPDDGIPLIPFVLEGNFQRRLLAIWYTVRLPHWSEGVAACDSGRPRRRVIVSHPSTAHVLSGVESGDSQEKNSHGDPPLAVLQTVRLSTGPRFLYCARPECSTGEDLRIRQRHLVGVAAGARRATRGQRFHQQRFRHLQAEPRFKRELRLGVHRQAGTRRGGRPLGIRGHHVRSVRCGRAGHRRGLRRTRSDRPLSRMCRCLSPASHLHGCSADPVPEQLLRSRSEPFVAELVLHLRTETRGGSPPAHPARHGDPRSDDPGDQSGR